MKKKIIKNISINNRKARFQYDFVEEYVAGIELLGSEIKSIRLSKVSINESYCYIHRGEVWIKGMHIGEYEFANIQNHDPLRLKRLLLKRREINKLLRTKNDGLTIIPVKIFINNRGLAKILIALAKGKKLHDKRQSIKERDMNMKLRKSLKDD